MELTYLQKLENFYNNNPKISRIGVTEQEIVKFEKKFSIKFPKAYKEFLFLAGNRDNILDDWNRNFDYLDWIQENIQESMDNVNLHLNPFFVFAEYANDQCLFFFLDEGENPPIYIYAEDKFHKNEKGEYVYCKKTFNTFSDFIDKSIDEALSK